MAYSVKQMRQRLSTVSGLSSAKVSRVPGAPGPIGPGHYRSPLPLVLVLLCACVLAILFVFGPLERLLLFLLAVLELERMWRDLRQGPTAEGRV